METVYETFRHPNCLKMRQERLYHDDGRPRLDNYGKPREAYVERIKNLPMPELMREARDKIWLSAFAASNPRSDYHWQVDVCYDALLEITKSDDAYTQAFRSVAYPQ